VTDVRRLALEPLRVDHAAEMVDLLGDPRLYLFTGGAAPSPAGLEALYRRQVLGRSPDGTERWLNWVIRRSTDHRAVGFVQATVTTTGSAGRQSAELAWVIGTAYQGQGYAQTAAAAMIALLREMGVAAFTANIHPDHAASQGVARSLGLRPSESVLDGEVCWRSD
jgi:RimJ/RimL family protein N-acetyltransferase